MAARRVDSAEMTLRVPAKKVSFAQDGLYYCDGAPFTGITHTEYPDGTPRSETEYREGLVWGRSRSWHANGALSDESEFFRDVLHGVAREWSPGGVLVSELVCEYGITISERKWDEQGQLLEEYRLQETDSDFERLQERRRLYGPEAT